MENKTAQQVMAILRKKRSYTYRNTMFLKNIPMPVDVKTARYLKLTNLFSFSKIENKG